MRNTTGIPAQHTLRAIASYPLPRESQVKERFEVDGSFSATAQSIVGRVADGRQVFAMDT